MTFYKVISIDGFVNKGYHMALSEEEKSVDLIKDLRGDIEVVSEPGKGSTFRVVLPIVGT